MIERVLENWLINASERSYQVPFCQSLSSRGQTVLHSTRHCAMEMGKDIIARDEEGFIHVYQLKSLKGRKLTQSEYRSDVAPQIMSLVLGKPDHPSIPPGSKVKAAYIVLSGDINEEASREISDLNATLVERQIDIEVKTVTFGELVTLFSGNLHKFGPREPEDSKKFLELFLSDGQDFFPKAKLASLLESCLSFSEAPKKAELREALSSTALICALAASKYQECNNWFADFECWCVYLASILRISEQWNIEASFLETELNIALYAMYSSLEKLADEVSTRDELVEGNALADSLLLPYKRTLLVGMASLYLIWSEQIGTLTEDRIGKVLGFIAKQFGSVALWGESSVPYLFASYLLMKRTGFNERAERILNEVSDQILVRNAKESVLPFPSFYYSMEACANSVFGASGEAIEDNFVQSSTSLESIIYLMVENGMRDQLAARWRQISYFTFKSYEPADSAEFLRWRSSSGTNAIKVPKPTQSWSQLNDEKNKIGTSSGNSVFDSKPFALLAFLLVFPHRMTPNLALLLHRQIAEPKPLE